MAFKVIVALCVLVAVAAAVPAGPGGPWGAAAWGPAAWGPAAWGPAAWGPPGAAGGANPFIPPWIATAPWLPQWSPCTTVGPSCVDCNTKLICTKIGGIQKACSDPTLPYCNAGECSATPTSECAPATEAPTAA